MRFQHGLAILAVSFAMATSHAIAATTKIVGFGDSLMAGYQLAEGESFTAQLETALREKGFDIEITNAGVSGDTTSGGLARLDWSVPEGTDAVILELGANDALRGIGPAITRDNLDAMIRRLRERDIAVYLVGMLAPPNMGQDYEQQFNPIYPELAETHGLPLYPFFLDGVVLQETLQLEDRMHPNAEGVAVMVGKFLPDFEQFLETLKN